MTAGIVIPQRGNDHLTENLLRGIRHFNWPVRIVIVNDDPVADVSLAIRELADDVVATRGLGVTAAWNLGIRALGDAHVVLLNNDVVCLGPFIERVITSDSICGAATRRDADLNGAVVLQGWCLCFPVSLWKQLGGFDERMRTYYSDTDFQVRAMKHGIPLVQVDLPLRHLGHRTAHDPQLFPAQRAAWREDRAEFLKIRAQL